MLVAVVAVLAVRGVSAQVDTGKIRLRPAEPEAERPAEILDEAALSDEPRRGFDFEVFEFRLQTLWFQRKTLIADGRFADGVRQSELIRAFCSEEGIGRLPALADALLLEAHRFVSEGQYSRAEEALDLADALDPGRSQIRLARASMYWRSGGGMISAVGELAAAVRASVGEGIRDFTLVNQVILIVVMALMGSLVLFSVLMAIRYQVPFRHEVEEWFHRAGWPQWGRPAGWGLLLLPLVTWIASGWTAIYWLVISFRFMRRPERLAAVFLLLATILSVPAYRVAVAVYGLTTDPVVRTTLEAATGPYSPERIVKLQKLVTSHPDDPTYRFLLGGLYKNGRYLEDAFEEYKAALEIDPSLFEANINIGNLYYLTGNFTEAAAYYLRALESEPDSILAYYNLHLAQAEAFRFAESREALDRATAMDSTLVTELMRRGREEERVVVIDAEIDFGSIWQASLSGGRVRQRTESEEARSAGVGSVRQQLLNPVSIAAMVALVVCVVGVLSTGSRGPARRCIRCGRPFCHYCKSGRQGQEYCSQCMHLFVLGDGLAPETKTRKLYEVQRYERLTRSIRRYIGLVLPGAGHLLRGKVVRGILLTVLWFSAVLAWLPWSLRPLELMTGLDVRLDLIRASAVPPVYALSPLTVLGITFAVLTWIVSNAGLVRRREG